MISREKRRFGRLKHRGEGEIGCIDGTNRVNVMRIESEEFGNSIVFLTGEDLARYGLSYRLLDAKGVATGRMVAELLSRIHEHTGIDYTKTRILIEAYPNGEGCILRIGPVIRKNDRKKKRYRETFRNPVAFHFGDKETLIEATRMFRDRFGGEIRRSALYRTPDGFRLLLYFVFSNRQPTFLKKECSYYAGQGILQEAYAVEYGKPIAFSNALELLSGKL